MNLTRWTFWFEEGATAIDVKGEKDDYALIQDVYHDRKPVVCVPSSDGKILYINMDMVRCVMRDTTPPPIAKPEVAVEQPPEQAAS